MGSSDHLHSESLDTASQLNFRIYIHKLWCLVIRSWKGFHCTTALYSNLETPQHSKLIYFTKRWVSSLKYKQKLTSNEFSMRQCSLFIKINSETIAKERNDLLQLSGFVHQHSLRSNVFISHPRAARIVSSWQFCFFI